MSFFLTNKKFYINIAIILVLIVVIIFGTLKALDIFTRHGEAINVPDFRGLYYEELGDNPEFENFKFEIMDSIYDITKEKGSIIAQDPRVNAKVKSGRTVYLTVISQNPEKVEMPNLKDLTLRNAKSLLESYGLKIEGISYVPDIAKNAVVEQKYRGSIIEEGTKIKKGSSIHLVLGLGKSKELLSVPMLIGLNRQEALEELYSASLNIGEEIFEDSGDSTKLRIYRQQPFYSEKKILKYGDKIDVWYKSEDNFDFEHYLQNLDTTALQTTIKDSLQE